MTTQFTYDELNRVSALAASSSAAEVSGYIYHRDETGKLKDVLELDNRTAAWTYDGINRLTGETVANAPGSKNGTVGYGLDPVGNRNSASSTISGLSPVSGTYDQDDRLASETYDQNGNVTATGGKNFTYDSQNQLISMDGTVALTYDGDGNRVAKTVSGVTTKYLVDELNPTGYAQVVEELSGGTVSRTYTYGLQRISEEQVISGAWTPSFYGYDGGGSVRQLTNAAGTVTDTNDFDAFGNLVNYTGSTPNDYMYRSEEWDSDLGLYYLRARYYNPLTGRFMSCDPEDGNYSSPAALHKYLYAESDPQDNSDPLGHSTAEREEEEASILKMVFGPNPVVSARLAAAGIATGSGLFATTAAITCVFFIESSGLRVFTDSSSMGGRLAFYYNTCSAMLLGTYSDSRASSQADSGGGSKSPPPHAPPPPCMCQPGWHMHHMLPQNAFMKAWFMANGRDLNVDDPQFLVCMPPGAHIGKGGLHPSGWNQEWTTFIEEHDDASAQDVLDQLKKMENEWRFQKPLSSCED